MQYEFHELCRILPDMSADQFRGIVADIKANGLHHDIVLHEGKILDGRHRYRACLECGVAPRFTQFVGKDALAFVISENLSRRHISESQRAMIAAKLSNLADGVKANSKGAPIGAPSVPQPLAAEMLNVSRRVVQRANVVKSHGTPELVAKVESGEMSVNEAERIAHLNPDAQRRIVAAESKQARQAMTEKAITLSAAAKQRHTAPSQPAQSQAGSQFVRLFLGRLEHLLNDIASREGLKGAEEIRDKFLREFDPNSEQLAAQFKHCKPVMHAIAEIVKRA
ncbi:MAG: hypothetical protein BGP24_14760 [Lysobacterales bacterium 69-70]|nr:ParB N-terminal domain-containing protein [Xanthomonadaceae bacterium]ODU35346.1 MAG: hypothetical protein ABS97_05590 [Xanthomonadaceae bacterium SCN 69-320]ODV17190.1 MAG: hypothetical protein ABT27_17650 [Xanthomonadaceae bacterium SCN 69-25]OJY94243.1 MAG: hypothetical protein BGP24_14760 [Xanthomonadales bacterium 69-70]